MMFKKQSGFSLLEIMVAAALLGGLALAGAKLMENQTKSMKTVEVRGEYNAVLTDIRSLLAVQENCTATYLNVVATGAPINQFINVRAPDNSLQQKYVANPNWRLGAAFGNGQVRILSYRMLSPDPADPGATIPPGAPVPPATTKLGSTSLIITFSFGQNRTVGPETIERRIRLNVELNAANQIQKCTSTGGLGADARYIWRVGGTAGIMTGDFTMSNSSQLRVQAGSNIWVDTGVINFTSDRRLKTNIRPLNEILPKLRQVRPVSYQWKRNQLKDYGVIAQEIQTVFPEVVHYNENEKVYTVDYLKLTPFLIQGLKEMDQENLELRRTIKELREEQTQTIQDIKLLKKHLCKNESETELCY